MATEKQLTKEPAPGCIVLGAGDIVDYQGVRERISPGSFVICADRGLLHCQKLEIQPDLLVGDFDSLGAPPEGIPRVTLPPEKNYTDTDHAVEEAEKRGFRRILFCGVLGGRLDHTLANLQILGACASRGLSVQITDGVTDVYALAAEKGPSSLTLASRENHYFSLLSLVHSCRGVTIRGGKYPLVDYPLSSLEARAVSNEFTGRPVTITLQAGVLLVTVLPMDGGVPQA